MMKSGSHIRLVAFLLFLLFWLPETCDAGFISFGGPLAPFINNGMPIDTPDALNVGNFFNRAFDSDFQAGLGRASGAVIFDNTFGGLSGTVRVFLRFQSDRAVRAGNTIFNINAFQAFEFTAPGAQVKGDSALIGSYTFQNLNQSGSFGAAASVEGGLMPLGNDRVPVQGIGFPQQSLFGEFGGPVIRPDEPPLGQIMSGITLTAILSDRGMAGATGPSFEIVPFVPGTSADFTIRFGVPEPSSLLLTAVGLLAMGIPYYWSAKRNP